MPTPGELFPFFSAADLEAFDERLRHFFACYLTGGDRPGPGFDHQRWREAVAHLVDSVTQRPGETPPHGLVLPNWRRDFWIIGKPTWGGEPFARKNRLYTLGFGDVERNPLCGDLFEAVEELVQYATDPKRQYDVRNWADMRLALLRYLDTRGGPPAGTEDREGSATRDGLTGGCWLWHAGTRYPVPKGAVYKLLDYILRRDIARYEDLMGEGKAGLA